MTTQTPEPMRTTARRQQIRDDLRARYGADMVTDEMVQAVMAGHADAGQPATETGPEDADTITTTLIQSGVDHRSAATLVHQLGIGEHVEFTVERRRDCAVYAPGLLEDAWRYRLALGVAGYTLTELTHEHIDRD